MSLGQSRHIFLRLFWLWRPLWLARLWLVKLGENLNWHAFQGVKSSACHLVSIKLRSHSQQNIGNIHPLSTKAFSTLKRLLKRKRRSWAYPKLFIGARYEKKKVRILTDDHFLAILDGVKAVDIWLEKSYREEVTDVYMICVIFILEKRLVGAAGHTHSYCCFLFCMEKITSQIFLVMPNHSDFFEELRMWPPNPVCLELFTVASPLKLTIDSPSNIHSTLFLFEMQHFISKAPGIIMLRMHMSYISTFDFIFFVCLKPIKAHNILPSKFLGCTNYWWKVGGKGTWRVSSFNTSFTTATHLSV